MTWNVPIRIIIAAAKTTQPVQWDGSGDPSYPGRVCGTRLVVSAIRNISLHRSPGRGKCSLDPRGSATPHPCGMSPGQVVGPGTVVAAVGLTAASRYSQN